LHRLAAVAAEGEAINLLNAQGFAAEGNVNESYKNAKYIGKKGRKTIKKNEENNTEDGGNVRKNSRQMKSATSLTHLAVSLS